MPEFFASLGAMRWRFCSSTAEPLARMERLLACHRETAGGQPAWDVQIETGDPPTGAQERPADFAWEGGFADGRPLQVRGGSRSWFEARVQGGGRVRADTASGKVVIHLAAAASLGECFLALLQLAMAERGRYTVHAGCVAREGRALLLLGESGAGKTTLSLALARRGWDFMGDDIVMVEDRGGVAVAHALLLPAKILRPDGGKDLVAVNAMTEARVAREAVVAGVARLCRDGHAGHALAPAPRPQTLLWMLEQGNDTAMYGARGAGWFDAASRVAETARGWTWRVGRLDGREDRAARAALEETGG